MSVFCCKPTLLTLPPELCLVKKEPTNEVIDISDDDLPNPIPVVGVEESTDDEVPVVFRVDNHYVSFWNLHIHTANACVVLYSL